MRRHNIEDFLFKFLSEKQKLSTKIIIHTSFWILVTLLNWELLYGNFPNIGTGEIVYFITIVLCNIPIFYILTNQINGLNFKSLFYSTISFLIIYPAFTYYALELALHVDPDAFYVNRWYSFIGHLSFHKVFFHRVLFAHSFGTSMVFLFIPFFARLIPEVFIRAFQKKQLEEENLKLELNFLRAQINPHFLFNTLNNIYGLVLDKEVAASSILKLSNLMRYSLYETGNESVSLKREIDFIEEYIDLERLRINAKKQITFEVKGNPGQLHIKPLILISFIENAIKHGLNKTNQKAWVNISIDIKKDQLKFSCSNSLANRNEVKDDPNDGIGIKNTVKRLEHYYPNSYSLSMVENDQCYTVNLELNLKMPKS